MTHRCKHAAAIKAALIAEGATAITIEREHGSVHISWMLQGRACGFSTAAHPRDPVAATNTSRQAMRRALREARVS